MRRHLSHVLPIFLLVFLVFPAAGVAADSSSAQAAHNCSDYFTYLMRQDLSDFDNPGECMSYVAHGGTLRIGHSSVVLTAGTDGFHLTFPGGYVATGLIPGSTVRLGLQVYAENPPYVIMECDLPADAEGNVAIPTCSGTSGSPPNGVDTAYTVKLSITDLTTGLLVVQMEASYPPS